MTIKFAFCPLVVSALLAFSPLHSADAKGGKTASTARSTTATASYGAPPVIRDHRANPQPWSLPRHWHHHGSRR